MRIAERHAVDSDIDDRRARLDPVAAHHFGSTDGRQQDVALTAEGGQVSGLRVGHGHRAVGGQKELRRGAAHQRRAADHHRVQARQAPQRLAQQDQAAERRAGGQGRLADRQTPGVDHGEPVHVLVRIERLQHRGRAD